MQFAWTLAQHDARASAGKLGSAIPAQDVFIAAQEYASAASPMSVREGIVRGTGARDGCGGKGKSLRSPLLRDDLEPGP